MAKASRIAARQAATLEQLAEKIEALEAKIDQLLELVASQKEEKAPLRSRSTK